MYKLGFVIVIEVSVDALFYFYIAVHLRFFFFFFTVCFRSPWWPLGSRLVSGEILSGEPTKSNKTVESTRYAVHIFQEFLQSRGLSTNFEGMNVEDLNTCLANFYSNVRRRQGENYSKNSLMAIRQGLRRHLQNPPFFRDFDIVTDSRFQEANNALKSAMRIAEINKMLNSSLNTSASEVNNSVTVLSTPSLLQ